MTPQQILNRLLNNPARRCRCGSARFYISTQGGLRCCQCSPGEAAHELIAERNQYGKLVWQEYFPDCGFDYETNNPSAEQQPEPEPDYEWINEIWGPDGKRIEPDKTPEGFCRTVPFWQERNAELTEAGYYTSPTSSSTSTKGQDG